MEEEYSTTVKKRNKDKLAPQEYLTYQNKEGGSSTNLSTLPNDISTPPPIVVKPSSSLVDGDDMDSPLLPNGKSEAVPSTAVTEVLTPDTVVSSTKTTPEDASTNSTAAIVGSSDNKNSNVTLIRPRALDFEESMKKIEEEKLKAAVAKHEALSSEKKGTDHDDTEINKSHEEPIISPVKFVALAIVVALLGGSGTPTPALNVALQNRSNIEGSTVSPIESAVDVDTVESVIKQAIPIDETVGDIIAEAETVAEETSAPSTNVETVKETSRTGPQLVEALETQKPRGLSPPRKKAQVTETSSLLLETMEVEAEAVANADDEIPTPPRKKARVTEVSSPLLTKTEVVVDASANTDNKAAIVGQKKIRFLSGLAFIQRNAGQSLKNLKAKVGANREKRKRKRDAWEQDQRRSWGLKL